jgi:hypothetical protein
LLLAQLVADRPLGLVSPVEINLLLLLSLDNLSDGKTVDLLGVQHFELVEVYEGPDNPYLLIIGVVPLQEPQSVDEAEDAVNVVFSLLLPN